jgi:hypothetical protein
MNPVDRGSREYPPCGYGLLGLCCSDCLQGPCRISPFEKTPALCGADSDLMVAGNLCRLSAKEFVLALKSFIRIVGEFRKRKQSTGTLSKALTENLALKYGIPGEELFPFLEKEATKLLDPLAVQPTLIFSSLLPERVFPQGLSVSPWGSLWSELFGLVGWKEHQGADPEALLWHCLNSAAGMLMIEEFAHDMFSSSPFRVGSKEGWMGHSSELSRFSTTDCGLTRRGGISAVSGNAKDGNGSQGDFGCSFDFPARDRRFTPALPWLAGKVASSII